MNNSRNFKVNFIFTLLCLFFISSCGSTSNTREISAQANEFRDRSERVIRHVQGTQIVNEDGSKFRTLNDLIQIPALDDFISRAFKTNPQLQQSVYALKIAYARAGVVESQSIPAVDLTISGQSAEEVSGNIFSSKLSVSWELDLWNKLREEAEAADYDVQVAEYNLVNLKNALVSNIMRTWLDITLQKKLVVLEMSRLHSLKQNLELIESRYKSGLDSLGSLDNARASVFNTRSTIAANEQKMLQAERSLNLLVGAFNHEVHFDAEQMEFPEYLNASISVESDVFYERPDVKASFLSFEAEKLRTSSAYKALLPSFKITGALTDTDSSLIASLLKDPLWQVLGHLSAPIFQGERLRNNARIAENKFAQQAWIYRDTLLNAINEVENAISQEEALKIQEENLKEAVASAQRSYVSFREKYQQGLVNIFDLLNSQQQTFDLKAQLIQIKYSRLTNRIDLGLALGLGVS